MTAKHYPLEDAKMRYNPIAVFSIAIEKPKHFCQPAKTDKSE